MREPHVVRSVIIFLSPIVIISALVIYFTTSNNRSLNIAETLKAWILIKCSVTAIVTIIWKPHFLAYIGAILVTPTSTFVPVFKPGWVAALFEAMYRKPEVSDLNRIK